MHQAVTRTSNHLSRYPRFPKRILDSWFAAARGYIYHNGTRGRNFGRLGIHLPFAIYVEQVFICEFAASSLLQFVAVGHSTRWRYRHSLSTIYGTKRRTRTIGTGVDLVGGQCWLHSHDVPYGVYAKVSYISETETNLWPCDWGECTLGSRYGHGSIVTD